MKELFEKGITFEEFVEESEENIAKRIKERYEKTMLDEDLIEKIKFKDEVNILAFAESWCPDSQVNVPIVAKIASYNKNFKLRILKREGNEEHMKPYYIDGKAKIPTFVFMDKDFKEIGHWIERPGIVKELAKSGEEDWRRDYLKGKYDKNVIEEIVNILSR
ncbi:MULTISPECIES: thioredoxin family protein [Thermoanaerobacter]|uniref:thioredoxin family protein n=1 Tax=Thermoanaerobacter TaxID=1754 RepID=UPI00048A5C75|nr:thioredoxin family protein [Thermoanaerobacter thermocopriae]